MATQKKQYTMVSPIYVFIKLRWLYSHQKRHRIIPGKGWEKYLLLVHFLILRFIACWLKVVIMIYTRHKNGNYNAFINSNLIKKCKCNSKAIWHQNHFLQLGCIIWKTHISYWLFGINRKNYARKQIFVKKYFYLQISDSDRGSSLV